MLRILFAVVILTLLCGCSVMKGVGKGALVVTGAACKVAANMPPPQTAFPKPGACVCGHNHWIPDGTEVAGAHICHRYRCAACNRRALVR